jgi:hypothetical protein
LAAAASGVTGAGDIYCVPLQYREFLRKQNAESRKQKARYLFGGLLNRVSWLCSVESE